MSDSKSIVFGTDNVITVSTVRTGDELDLLFVGILNGKTVSGGRLPIKEVFTRLGITKADVEWLTK